MLIVQAIFVALLGMLVAFGTTGQALAASHQEKKAEEKPADTVRHHEGSVKAVDPTAGTLTVAEKEGEATVSVSEKTLIKKGKESLKLSGLKPGDEVTVHYVKEGGKDVARDVTVKAQ
jgi:Cu/Ag efflux protein CusF